MYKRQVSFLACPDERESYCFRIRSKLRFLQTISAATDIVSEFLSVYAGSCNRRQGNDFLKHSYSTAVRTCRYDADGLVDSQLYLVPGMFDDMLGAG